MKNILALSPRPIVVVFATVIVAALAIATFKSRVAPVTAGDNVEAHGATSDVVAGIVLNAGSAIRHLAIAVVNPKLPDSLEIPTRGSVHNLRQLGYSEDEINQMWLSFQQNPASSSLPGWSQWQDPYGAILP